MSTYQGVNACLAYCPNSVLNVKVLVGVGAFNQEKVLVGAFSVIVKTDGSFAAPVLLCCRSDLRAVYYPQLRT